jgi:hypothetical protein
MYKARSGRLRIYIKEADGSTITIMEVKKGDFIGSWLSFTDYLTDKPGVFSKLSLPNRCNNPRFLNCHFLPSKAFLRDTQAI